MINVTVSIAFSSVPGGGIKLKH